MAVSNAWMKKFFSINMQQVMKYLLSFNCESQVLAIDGSNAENIQTTGTKQVFLSGVPITLPADAEYDISAELPYAAWTTGQSYTTDTEVTDEEGKHWVCIASHTSGAASHPLTGTSSETYWKRLDKWAVAGVGNSVAQDKQAHYLVCALSSGVLRAFIAYTIGTEAATTAVVIPAYDPERYVPIGLISVVPTNGAHVLGTTSLNTVGTFKQFTGPVFPHADLIDKN